MQTEIVPICIEKRKVGPVTERYVDGEYRPVEREINGRKRVALIDLDNSHRGNCKVTYASDPVLVFSSPSGTQTHDELRRTLQKHGLWMDELSPVDIAHGDGWRAGFKSLPRSADMLDVQKTTLKRVVDRDHDLLEGNNGVTAYVPA